MGLMTEKMNPTMIKTFDVKRSKTITTHFFDMGLTSGDDCKTVKALFTAIGNKLMRLLHHGITVLD